MDGVVTGPLSIALPTPEELRLNDALVAELHRHSSFESPEDSEKRRRVLNHLQNVAKEFVGQVGGMRRTETVSCYIRPFGSYRLGVSGPGSDIDVVIIAPDYITRDDFFENFPLVLERLSPPGAIQKINSIRDAYVPIINLEYLNISIDLVFTRLPGSLISISLDLSDKSLLRGLDAIDIKIISDSHVADEILTLVPQARSFQHALRAIKFWAQRRAIYGKVMGFPGGVAWAILVARICQLYPKACGATIVAKFFHIIMKWPWPWPVLLKNIENGPLNIVRAWNPKLYASDRRHLMPVITPVYPSACVTQTITLSTKAVILRELGRGAKIATEIMAGKQTWKHLFERHTFFTQDYRYYLTMIVASRTLDAQRMWAGRMRANVCWLIAGIDGSDTGIDLACPYTQGLARVHLCKSEEEVDVVLRGDLQFQLSEERIAELDTTAKKSESANGTNDEVKPRIIYTTTYYIGLVTSVGAGKRVDLSMPLADFKRQCTGWKNYQPDLNFLRIVVGRNYDLPNDVFMPEEMRPEKKKDKVKKTAKHAESFDLPFREQNTLEIHKRKINS